MKWTSSIHTKGTLSDAIREAVAHLKLRHGSEKADIGLIFISPAFRNELIKTWGILRKTIPVTHMLGCSAGGVIGGGHEVEDRPAVSLISARLPGVKLAPFMIRQDELPNLDGSPKEWRDLVHANPLLHPQFLLISDPFSIDANTLVSGLDFAFPQAVKIGGLASGGHNPDENFLILNDRVVTRGTVGLSLWGDIAIETVVAQGCRPIGEPLSVTSCENTLLQTVNHQAPLEYLSDLYERLSEKDQGLMRTSLFLGLNMDPFNDQPRQGDFLIRNIMGVDPEGGALAIGALLRPGQKVQFHLRDAITSHNDLQTLLSRSRTAQMKHLPSESVDSGGALVFSCLGRGKRLYGEVDHDIQLVKSQVGNIPVGGFFCNGEIGPVAGKTYLHGYTSSIAFFTPRSKSVIINPAEQRDARPVSRT